MTQIPSLQREHAVPRGGSPGSSSSDVFHGMHWKEQTFPQLQPLKALPLLEQLGGLEKEKVIHIMAGGKGKKGQ